MNAPAWTSWVATRWSFATRAPRIVGRALGLTALSDTATDLAAHLEVDQLLQAICRRARLLLGTDVAYVTLRDDAIGDTYVEATDGIVSEAFRMMRLPAGTGLGGLVAQTGRPEATADYAGDQRLQHSPDVDQRVAAEGLKGIVAAPLKRGGEVFGVLMSGLARGAQLRRLQRSRYSPRWPPTRRWPCTTPA